MIEAPDLSLAALAPFLFVFGAACVGVLVEAFGPRGEVVFEYRGVVRGRNFAERQAAAADRRSRTSRR